MRVVRRKLSVNPTEIEHGVDLADQMVGRHHLDEIKGIEKLPLSVFPPPHHAPPPENRLDPTESRFANRLKKSSATQSNGEQTLKKRCRDKLNS